jgi:hypothetical protein
MGLFDKLFGKKQAVHNTENPAGREPGPLQAGDTFIATGDPCVFKIIRPLTEAQKDQLDRSTIPLRTGQLYMHYWTDNMVDTDRNDPEWQNMVLFFWKAEEPFPKKSLPPVFQTFAVRHFLFTGDTSGLTLQVGQAMPWFGMPGLGEKHVCEKDGERLTIPELGKLGLVEYVEQVELTGDHPDILTEKERYMFLMDERISSFQNGFFYLGGKPVPVHVAYSVGGIHILKRSGSA